MTKDLLIEMLGELNEVRHEISRLNQAAGHTVFNPTATSGLDSVIRNFEHQIRKEPAE